MSTGRVASTNPVLKLQFYLNFLKDHCAGVSLLINLKRDSGTVAF